MFNRAFKNSEMHTSFVQSGRIGAEEVINDEDGRAAEELEERLKEKEAKTQAILLEMVRTAMWLVCLTCSSFTHSTVH